MSGSHHHHHGRPPRDANAEASAVRGRLAWVRSTFSPMMKTMVGEEEATTTDKKSSEEERGGSGEDGSSRAAAAATATAPPSGGSRSIASQVVAAYSDILEELIADVALEAHRAWRTGAASRTPAGVNLEGPTPLERRRSEVVNAATATPASSLRAAAVAAAHEGGGDAEAAAAAAATPVTVPPAPAPAPPVRLSRVDAFGQPLKASSAGDVACPACGRRVAAARFAPHLEKCLGGGRAAGRTRAAAAR